MNAKNNSALDLAAVKAIYSDLKIQWADGKKIVVYELPVEASARETSEQASMWHNLAYRDLVQIF